jgi:CrcB protein
MLESSYFSAMIWYVAAGSALGGVLRFLMVPWAQRAGPAGFPFGTLAVNILGSLAIGAVLRLASAEGTMSAETRVFLTVGLLGGFTTFSAFSAETMGLMQSGEWARAGANILASVVLCLLASFAGWSLGGGFLSLRGRP